MSLRQIVESASFDAPQIAARTSAVRAAVLNVSQYVDAPNFHRIHPDDLRRMFVEYDRQFFGDAISRALGDTPLRFRLSPRMTSAGGKTACYGHRGSATRHYEISASSALLFNCFHEDDHRPPLTSGLACNDRLDALQRILEHEIVHLIEMLLWDDSSCSQSRFQSIARRFFGHVQHTHQLITPRERALVRFGIRPGSRVRFHFEGIEHTGTVNRVNKRATVLVECPEGQPYSDGKRYRKFYIPLPMLEAIS